jgi:hypothetical protein
MKLTSRRKALNPAFKRFQYLPHLQPGRPANSGSGLSVVLAYPVPGEAQRLATLANVPIDAAQNTQPFSAQTCE